LDKSNIIKLKMQSEKHKTIIQNSKLFSYIALRI
ncbi:unnamed protein product, partial [marine sediment metagenome]